MTRATRFALGCLSLLSAIGCSADMGDSGRTESVVEEIRCGGTTCALPGATATCHRGACVIASCAMFLGDCNHRDADGCEVNLGTSITNCGSCGTRCAVRAGATATCTLGGCGYTCNPGFADCDHSAANGCEVNLNSNAANCGACGASCGPSGVACCAGRCAPTSADPLNCGACGNVCPSGPNAVAACSAGVCSVACNYPFTDCDRNAANGCEANTGSDVANCGACGFTCAAGQSCPLGHCGTVTLKVSLSWSVAADMDLHVVTPAGHEISYSLRSADGGTLNVDVTNGTGPESTLWTAAPPTGTYLVCAVPYNIPGPTSFTVAVTNSGVALTTWTGSYAASNPVALPCSRTSPSFVGEFTL